MAGAMSPRKDAQNDAQHALELAVFAGGRVTRHPLPAEGRVSLGRSKENDVQIDESSVSRRHAIIHLGARLAIEDLGSANGTRLRRERSAGPTTKLLELQLEPGKTTELAVGDAVNLGSTLIVILPREGAASAAAGQAPGAPIVRDPAMQRLYALAERVAASPLSVLLLGETGAGKEVLAEHIHRRSPRAHGPFLRLNCAALAESLLESELFGHEKGAFTSAGQAKPGLLETAEKGTVMLDEVGELPPGIQVKLLRVLEDRKVMRVGGLSPRPIDVRFISATNRDLTAEVKRGAFREDLFFRLNGIALTIPPLRARVSEIAPLARAIAERTAGALGRRRRRSPPRRSPRWRRTAGPATSASCATSSSAPSCSPAGTRCCRSTSCSTSPRRRRSSIRAPRRPSRRTRPRSPRPPVSSPAVPPLPGPLPRTLPDRPRPRAACAASSTRSSGAASSTRWSSAPATRRRPRRSSACPAAPSSPG
ncbi:uncharacterized protein SOCE836_009880 [Sorangium cellulosum]|uniref:Fis family transcriptional regulator n=1 Tax=Sorangium cellulosum TaxID=56 RepID=A0A4P2QHV2_SORCE|nr:uncharacterized protein SOCE836_009880 [Sorangium cellulosum]